MSRELKTSGRARGWIQMLLGAVLGVAITVVGLAQAGKLQPPADPQVLVALGQLLDTEHRRIDLLLEKQDVAGAIDALEGLRKGPWPDRRTGGDAAIQLRHDAYGRLIRLRLDHPGVDAKSGEELLALVQEGLGPEWERVPDNVFTARMLALRGEVLESLGRDDEALLTYERALDINRGLLDELLKKNGK
jgi:tetratricopeptide (TPR) repeat protein